MGFIVSKDDEEADELVRMIDRLIESGDGSISVTVNEEGNGLEVNRFRTKDCGGDGKTACCQPTEDAIDNDED